MATQNDSAPWDQELTDLHTAVAKYPAHAHSRTVNSLDAFLDNCEDFLSKHQKASLWAGEFDAPIRGYIKQLLPRFEFEPLAYDFLRDALPQDRFARTFKVLQAIHDLGGFARAYPACPPATLTPRKPTRTLGNRFIKAMAAVMCFVRFISYTFRTIDQQIWRLFHEKRLSCHQNHTNRLLSVSVRCS